MKNRFALLWIALAAFAWIVPSAALASDAAAGDAAAGGEKYTMFCATCHGASGQGDGVGAQGIEPPPRDFSTGEFSFDADGNGTPGEDIDLVLVIQKGAAEYGGSMLMTPWAGALSDDDINDVVAFIRTLQK